MNGGDARFVLKGFRLQFSCNCEAKYSMNANTQSCTAPVSVRLTLTHNRDPSLNQPTAHRLFLSLNFNQANAPCFIHRYMQWPHMSPVIVVFKNRFTPLGLTVIFILLWKSEESCELTWLWSRVASVEKPSPLTPSSCLKLAGWCGQFRRHGINYLHWLCCKPWEGRNCIIWT